MRPTHVEKPSKSYTIQLVICVILVMMIAIGMGIYIAKLNAWIALKQTYLKIPHSLEWNKRDRVLIIDSNGIRHDGDFIEDSDNT